MEKYIRVKGKNGVLLISLENYEDGLDRENEGVVGEIIEEADYYKILNK